MEAEEVQPRIPLSKSGKNQAAILRERQRPRNLLTCCRPPRYLRRFLATAIRPLPGTPAVAYAGPATLLIARLTVRWIRHPLPLGEGRVRVIVPPLHISEEGVGGGRGDYEG